MIQPACGYIEDLDALDFPDWGGLDFHAYGNSKIKYSHALIPRQFPYALSLTSRGCPYSCTFCAAATVTGKRIRKRSSENVLREIDMLHNERGIREIIFLDDQFLAYRKRALEIMQGLAKREYDLTWKVVNDSVWLMDEEILDWMKRSGAYQFTISVESGHPRVLKELIKKPVNLGKVPPLLEYAKKLGFEIICNFVIGTPGETWDEIRHTIRYAESLDIDLVNFHIATPLPKTELMKMAVEGGYLLEQVDEDINRVGYTQGTICTPEFSPDELKTLRAFEWDRINFSTQARKETIARIEGITMEELEQWRKNTRCHLGSSREWAKHLVSGPTVEKVEHEYASALC